MEPYPQSRQSRGFASATMEWLWRTRGKGLNSIPNRFALMSLMVTSIVFWGAFKFLIGEDASPALLGPYAYALMLSVVPTTVTYLAANRLSHMIRALRDSTQAVISGDMTRPIDIDEACELGELADSFRAMIGRLNQNILRMNILAYTDPVTRLPNRAVMNHALSVMRENRSEATLIFIDLDGFKQVNDTLGHEAGDELLRQVSDRMIERGFNLTRDQIDNCTTTFGELRATCPESLVFARFSGDEFVALIPKQMDRLEILRRSRQIIESVSDTFMIKGTEVCLGASIGVARTPFDTTDHEELLSFADLAMYAAKKAGKGRMQFFNSHLRDIVVEEARVEADLRRAIERDEFVLHFQPKVDAQDFRLRSVEALARWQHPERGCLLPTEFIELAEKRGLMPDLGNCVLHLAAKQVREWMERDFDLPVSINVSAAQFERPQLVSEVLKVLDHHRVDPELIEVEITESMVMSDFVETRRRLRRLQEAGVKVSIDDFGTGFSNLSQLAQLPCDILKIDRSLIAEIGRNSKSEAIIHAIVSMADALGHEIVAEGIETREQLDFLRHVGCLTLQGHLFGEAMSAPDLENWEKARMIGPARAAFENLRMQMESVARLSA